MRFLSSKYLHKSLKMYILIQQSEYGSSEQAGLLYACDLRYIT